MNNMKMNKACQEVVWMQLTAGQGPKECGWVVAQLCKQVLKESSELALNAEFIESRAFDKALRKQNLVDPDAYQSVLLRVEGNGASQFALTWKGSIKWHGESPYCPLRGREKSKRVNWFVGVGLVEVPSVQEIELRQIYKDVKVESMRASGPGGQHVNKTNSAVRITHRPTGVQVRVESDRSQHRNRQLAMERLHMILVAGCTEDEKAQERLRWLNHYQVKRGSPTRVFHGSAFVEKAKKES